MAKDKIFPIFLDVFNLFKYAFFKKAVNANVIFEKLLLINWIKKTNYKQHKQ